MIRIDTSFGTLLAGPAQNPNSLGEYDIIWNLAAELDFFIPAEEKHANIVLWGEINDRSIPLDIAKFENQLDTVVSSLERGGTVFVHCLGGIGRTSMAVALILIKLQKFSVEAALLTTKKLLRGPETNEQKCFVKALAESFR